MGVMLMGMGSKEGVTDVRVWKIEMITVATQGIGV